MKLIYTIIISLLLVNHAAGQFKEVTNIASKERAASPVTNKVDRTVQTHQNPLRVNIQQGGTCPANIGFEAGTFENWQCGTGFTMVRNNANVINIDPSPPVNGRHTLIARAATSGVDPYGFFPLNPPDGSGYAVKLGNTQVNEEAERITYQFTVPANATEAAFSYRYAVVFQDPNHQKDQQPRFIARMLDVATNTYLPCASNEYIATAALPGFQQSTVDPEVKFKPWSSAFINLSEYAGKTLQLEFTTADCTQGQHWGYAYIDVGDCDVTANANYQCKINTATFTGPPGFQEYRWYDDNFRNLIGTGENLVLSPAPVVNNVNVIVVPFNGFGCSDTLQASINPILPIAKAGADTVFCPGKPLMIGTPGDNRFTYSWSPADFLSDAAVATPVSTSPNATSYEVTVTSIESGCVAKDTINLSVFQPITITPSADQTICEGQRVNLQASGGAVTYAWSPAVGLNRSNVPNPVAAPRTTTKYQVVGFDGHQCFTDTGYVKVTVNPLPRVDVGPDVVLSTGSTHAFKPVTPDTNIVSWQWSPSDYLSCTSCSTPTAEIKKSITYRAVVKNEYGCVAGDSMTIRTFCQGAQAFIPNAFTPDGDGLNDILLVRGKGISHIRSFRIFSRWGELVFEKSNFPPNDPSFGWDGRVRGKTAPPEVYVYMAEVVCENDLINTYKGNITLLR
jgi:gliding motility-associated-like protein